MTPAISAAATQRTRHQTDLTTAPTSDQQIAVIISSTRPTRICPGIAAWARNALDEQSTLGYELIDLAEVDLPMLDEPLKAALRQYTHPHTKAWSEQIDRYAGFVFVLPQYNWGYPAPLKNALDYLYEEWHDKPATTITYGTRGGSKAADQINELLLGLHMRPLPSRLELVITDNDVDDHWQLIDLEMTMRPYHPQLLQIDADLTKALSDSQS